MPLMKALATAPQALTLRTALPDWLIYLTKRGREVLCGHKEMEVGHLSRELLPTNDLTSNSTAEIHVGND